MATNRWRQALQRRLATLAAAALIVWTIGTAVAASIMTSRIVNGMVEERAGRARAIAKRLERVLQTDLRTLDLVAGASLARPPAEALAARVRDVRLADAVLRVAPDGRVLWTRSVVHGSETAAPLAALAQPTPGRWRAEGTPVQVTRAGRRAFLVLPARESDETGGAFAAAIDPTTTELRSIVASYADEPYRVALVDAIGQEIAGSRDDDSAHDDDAVVAMAAILNGAWQIRLVQPRDEAIAPVLALRRTLVGSSILFMAFAVLIARAAARSIRQPVLGMTTAAERLARGDHGEPIPAAGEDEIGRLAAALEALRSTLARDERRNLLLKRVIAAQEDERRRIARELHDQTAQQLTALGMQIDAVSTAHPTTRDELARSQRLVHSTIDDLHRVIYDLRPAMLDDLGLLPAIRSFAETHLAAHGVRVHCDFADPVPMLTAEANTALFRIVQEALSNVARHANADAVMIACTVRDGRITLEVEDDGVGFDVGAGSRPRDTGQGLGLLGMRERLALLGGELDIESEPGHGTRVIASLPLAPFEVAGT
jgi:signal transduction histidine kinase